MPALARVQCYLARSMLGFIDVCFLDPCVVFDLQPFPLCVSVRAPLMRVRDIVCSFASLLARECFPDPSVRAAAHERPRRIHGVSALRRASLSLSAFRRLHCARGVILGAALRLPRAWPPYATRRHESRSAVLDSAPARYDAA